MIRNISTRKVSHVWLWMGGILLFIIAAMGIVVWPRLGPNPLDPIYEKHRLSYWLNGHPREYHPAVRALGTNAMPYLLSELQVTDPAWLQWAEKLLGLVDIGPLWDTSEMHHYHARLALQILDTNALPALIDVVFDRPMQMADGNLGYEAAKAMSWLASPAAKDAIQQQLSVAMQSPDAAMRRNACLAIAAGNGCTPENAARLAVLTRDDDYDVRAAAMRARK